jgi:hypothetical protein
MEWFKPTPLAKYQFLFYKWRPNFFIAPTLDSLNFEIFDSDYKPLSVATPITNKWYLVAMIHQGNSLKSYVYDASGLLGTNQRGDIGPSTESDNAQAIFSQPGWWGSDNAFYQGFIDDIRIYNRALSAAEIQAIYNATK